MANQFMQQVKSNPSFSEPDLIITQAQASGAFAALADGAPRVKIGSGDLYVYINSLDIRTDAQASQSSFNNIPAANLVADYISTQTYLLRSAAVYDHHDMDAAANYAIGLPDAQDLALNQGIFNAMRNGLLYGFTPSNNEGLLNAQYATAVTLPQDHLGNTTVVSYDNGDMFQFILQQIINLKTSMFQTGGNITNRVVIVSPQRVFAQFQNANVIQVTSYQRPGAGTATIGQAVQAVVQSTGDEIEYYFDDTLIGKGASGADMVILTIPEIEVPKVPGVNTNVAGEIKPGLRAINLMYADMPKPMKIPTPVPDGGIRVVNEIRVSSGWNVRGAGLFLISMPY